MDVFFKGSLDRITASMLGKGGWAVISLVKMDNSAFLSTTFFESSLTFPIASITNEPKFGDFKQHIGIILGLNGSEVQIRSEWATKGLAQLWSLPRFQGRVSFLRSWILPSEPERSSITNSLTVLCHCISAPDSLNSLAFTSRMQGALLNILPLTQSQLQVSFAIQGSTFSRSQDEDEIVCIAGALCCLTQTNLAQTMKY